MSDKATAVQLMLKIKSLQLLFVTGVMAALLSAFIFIKSTEKTQAAFPQWDCKSWKTEISQHKTTLMTKAACARHCFLLILVSSAPANFKRRNLIRQTWGTDSNVEPRWRTFFLLGQTRNETLTVLLETEEKSYGDIIRGNYFEHYWNQSLKVEMGFEWAARYCQFSFLLKADDDVFVNTKDLILLLQRASPKNRLYMGKVQFNPKVRRYGKFSVSYDEYSGSTYPSYCSGAGFVLSYDVVDCLVPLFDVANPFRIDDAYVGILVNKVGITPVHQRWFIFPDTNYDDCYFLPNSLVQHRVVGQCLIKLFRIHSKGFYDSILGSFY